MRTLGPEKRGADRPGGRGARRARFAEERSVCGLVTRCGAVDSSLRGRLGRSTLRTPGLAIIAMVLAGCGTEVVELASIDGGTPAEDTGVIDSGPRPPADTGVLDLGFPDLGFVDAGFDAGVDGGLDSGAEDNGVPVVTCTCLLRCSTDRECAGIDPTSTCSAGYCTIPPAAPGCTTDSDCVPRATCMTVAEPATACP